MNFLKNNHFVAEEILPPSYEFKKEDLFIKRINEQFSNYLIKNPLLINLLLREYSISYRATLLISKQFQKTFKNIELINKKINHFTYVFENHKDAVIFLSDFWTNDKILINSKFLNEFVQSFVCPIYRSEYFDKLYSICSSKKFLNKQMSKVYFLNKVAYIGCPFFELITPYYNDITSWNNKTNISILDKFVKEDLFLDKCFVHIIEKDDYLLSFKEHFFKYGMLATEISIENLDLMFMCLLKSGSDFCDVSINKSIRFILYEDFAKKKRNGCILGYLIKAQYNFSPLYNDIFLDENKL